MSSDNNLAGIGRVAAMWRYPIKSMLGEQLDAAEVTPTGLAGDRALALIDAETGKVVSAKNPRRWPNMFEFHARLFARATDAESPRPARITLPNGDTLTTDDADVESVLSNAVGRSVRLARSANAGATAEGYWPDVDWLEARDSVFDFGLPPGTFFDAAAIHLITTATLRRLAQSAPESQFDPRRFRPNFVIETNDDTPGFVEDGWIGTTLAIGGVRLRVDGHCPRCVMTTLQQGTLPKDPRVLRTAVEENKGNVGVYATVLQAGAVRVGDVLSRA